MEPFFSQKDFSPLLILFLLFLISAGNVYGGTCANGLQSGVWGPWGSPYIAIGGVTVQEGDTLIIEPGTVILIAPNYSGFGGAFRVEGTLIARGLPENPIIFTGLDLESVTMTPGNPSACSAREKAEPGVWAGLQFFTPGPGSLLRNCHILYTGRGGSPAVAMGGNTGFEDPNLTISGCLVAYGAGDGILLNTGASPLILNTTVKDNGGRGISELDWVCHSVVQGCTIVGNGGYAVETYAGNVRNYGRTFVAGNGVDAFRITSETIDTSGLWLDHGVPYHYDRGTQFAIPVREGDTLTLEAGVEIQFGRNRGLEIKGILIANGDSCRLITLGPLDPETSWGRLQFSGGGGLLNYVDYRNGKSLMLQNVRDQIEVSNSRFIGGPDKGLEITGNSAPVIRNNLIADHVEEGIWVAATNNAVPQFRLNRIQNNQQGMRIYLIAGNADLGTVADPGHNAFSGNTNWALVHNGKDTLFAVGNYWVSTDSLDIDTSFIYDNTQDAASGPVIFVPFDEVDRSAPPVDNPECPPACQAISVTITRPTSGTTWTTRARYLTLGGMATDDQGVATVSWSNAATGQQGNALVLSPRTACEWSAAGILLQPGANLVTVTAVDLDGCAATDEITVTYDDDGTNCWLFDDFDNLDPGSLEGKSGWITVPGRASAEVIANPFGDGQVIRLDPPTDEPIIMGKIVTPQSAGVHALELLVLAEPGDTSMAKIEVRTTGNPAWDKKFQLYFGQTMRLNYGPTRPEAVDFLYRAEAYRWYHVRAEIDLATDLVDIYLDDALVLDDIAVGPGPVEEVSMSGWNFPGYVLYDDLRGCPTGPVVGTTAPLESKSGIHLWQNYPNPFVGQTTIRFELSSTQEVTLTVNDLLGREITTLVAARLTAGTYEAVWNANDAYGRKIPAGVYLYCLRAGTTLHTGRMVLGKD